MPSEAEGHPFAARPRRRRQDPRVLGAVAAGGFLGGEARYLLGLAFPTAHGTFPATIFAINVSGSFILALLLVLILEVWPPTKYLRPLLATGFCGAYTTFSTWMVDTDRLVSAGRYAIAAANIFGSLFAGLAATTLGLALGRALVTYRRRRAVAASLPEQHSEPSESEALR
ncbi:MAG TPA: CrcB family protein [Actinospica sp.]|nr:CrcB family protein [Actinospica sp.]